MGSSLHAKAVRFDLAEKKFVRHVQQRLDGSSFGKADVTVAGSVDDSGASITFENLANWNGSGQNPTGQNFSYQINLKPGLNTLRLTATSKAGTTTQAQLNLNLVPLSLVLASPADGEIVTTDSVTVLGTFAGPPGTSVTVKGIQATIDGNTFAALVPLGTGSNYLAARVSSPDGATLTRLSEVIYQTSVPPYVFFYGLSDGSEFVAGSPVYLTIAALYNYGGFATLPKLEILQGDMVLASAIDQMFLDFAWQGLAVGSYTVTARGTDSKGVVGTQTVTFTVVPDPVDVSLKAIWGGMNEALVAGDKTRALSYLSDAAKAKYGPVFDVLIPRMQEIVEGFTSFERVEVSDALAEYAINRTIDGVNRIFFIYFMKDDDGVWQIDSM